MATSTFLGFAISVLAPFLVAELHISRADLGWLFTAFAGVGAAGSIFAGRAADAVGGRWVLLWLFALVAIFTLAAAAAPSYAWLVAIILLAGLPNAAGNPATNKLIAVHVPAGGRGTIIGIKQSGVQAAVFLAGAVLPLGAVTIGWRPALALTATIPVIGLLGTIRVVPPDPAGPVPDNDRTRGRPMPHPSAIRWMAVYACLMGAGGAVTISYLPLYAYEAVGLTATGAGAAAAALGLVATVARILWARWSERFTDFAAPLGVLAVASVAAVIGIWGAAAAGPWLLWIGAILAGASVAAWNAVGMLAVVVLSDPSAAGRASGLVLLGFFGGYTVSPVLFGYTVDLTGRYNLAWAGTAGVLTAAALVAWLWRRSAEPRHLQTIPPPRGSP